jgi:TnpA family transposase
VLGLTTAAGVLGITTAAGVLIYWHVERGSVVVDSQHLTCSASEVHAMSRTPSGTAPR